ncbi:MAG: hypothetical protein NT007_03095 [Candidatus Kapabacteria bacterium]|nr:hypothetical protein [Candidatus Kapabacteria bacterium]
MAISKDKRMYSMLDADLCMFTSNLCNFMTRDLSDLAVFGITSLAVTNLDALCDAFEILPADETYLADQMEATQAKNDIAAQVRETIRTMAMRVEMKWGIDSPKYKSLNVSGLTKMSDSVLLFTARNVYTKCNGWLTDLASLGLTSGMLSDYSALNNSFEDALNDLSNAISIRDEKTSERIASGNELYGFVVRYCEMGKRIYANTNPSKYNDYKIYDTSGGGGAMTSPTNFAYNFNTNVFSWDAVANATSYQIEASDNGTDWAEIYADVALTFNYIPSSGVEKHYRVRARNSSGFGEFATELLFTYYDSLSQPSGLILGLTGAVYPLTVNADWDTVTGATNYKVYRSIVNTGASSGTYSLVDTVASNTYSELTIDDKRYYYYVIAINSYLESAACSSMFIDVPVNPA